MELNYDILIKNGHIVDGTGNPWFKTDLAIKNGRIAKICRLGSGKADRIIDARNFIVAPGFIDIHNHSEITVFLNSKCDNMIKQGISTQVVGNCGYSAAPVSDISRNFVHGQTWPIEIKPVWSTFREYFEKIEKQGVSTNMVSLAGHGYIRSAVMGFENRAPTEKELEEMKILVAEAMKDGTVGLSTGLGYPPGCYAETDELVELCKVVAKYGGFYATHTRDPKRKENFIEAIIEAIEIGERSGVPVHISHMETHYDAWGLQNLSIKVIEEARMRGIDVTCDVCVGYLHSQSWLAGAVMPFWTFEGGGPRMIDRLKDPATRKRMKEEMVETRIEATTADGYWDRYIVLSSEGHPEFVGKNMQEIAEEWNKDPWDAAFDLLLDEGEKCTEISLAKMTHNEEDMRTVLKYPFSIPETDASVLSDSSSLGVIHPHPRGYGNLPLIFRKYVRGESGVDLPKDYGTKLLTLEDAVRKMTSLPAQRIGLRDRGLLREGMWADIVVFDEAKIKDMATFTESRRYPKGIAYVIVNGEIVVDLGEHIGALPGKVLKLR